MRTLVVAVLCYAALSGCARGSGSAGGSNILPGKIEPSTGPYVSVAVDNHFHDVHAQDDITFDRSRPFVVRNEGSNLHNVTIVETGFSRDLRTGRSVEIMLEPGTYHLVCKYHSDQKMTGRFTIE